MTPAGPPVSRFAVVAGPDEVSSLTGMTFDRWAACAVDGDVAAVHFAGSLEELIDRIQDYPVVPSRPGCATALPGYEAEILALSMLADEAAASAGPIPEGFLRGGARMEGGLMARITPYGLDLRVSRTLASQAGWRPSDTLSLSSSPDGRLLAVGRGTGPRLMESMDEPDWYTTESDLQGVPLVIRLAEGDWTPRQYELRNGSVVFETPGEAPPAGIQTPPPPAPPAPAPARAGFSATSLLLGSAAAAVAGFAAAAIWL